MCSHMRCLSSISSHGRTCMSPCFYAQNTANLLLSDLSKGYSYSRSRNPTVEALANKVNKMEGGAGATMFGTGMAATVTVNIHNEHNEKAPQPKRRRR